MGANALSTALERYARVGFTPGPLLALLLLVAVGALFWRPRRPGYRLAFDGAVFGLTGLAVIMVSVATATYDMRYLMPALFLIPTGAALGVERILRLARAG